MICLVVAWEVGAKETDLLYGTAFFNSYPIHGTTQQSQPMVVETSASVPRFSIQGISRSRRKLTKENVKM